MSDSSGWWAKKLGTPAPPQQQQAPSYPATGPVYRGPAPLPPATENTQVTKDNVVEMAGRWQGGQGTKTETSTCPQCGSGDYFSRTNVPGSKVINTNSGSTSGAAPHCYSCGYNGMYTQAGG